MLDAFITGFKGRRHMPIGPMSRPARFQFTLRGLLVLVTMVACVLSLARCLRDYGGLVVAIPLTIVPFSITSERLFGAFPKRQPRGLFLRYLVAIVAACFLMLNWYLGRSVTPQPIPARFPIVLGTATICSLWWFAFGWQFGIEYQGATFTWGILGINALSLVLLWRFWLAFRRRATRGNALVLATLLHCWLFWFAFPYFGELP